MTLDLKLCQRNPFTSEDYLNDILKHIYTAYHTSPVLSW